MNALRTAPVALAVALTCVAGTQAHAFPDRDITLIVPWSAGGGTDTLTRTLAQYVPACLGVNANVVNQTGANGAVGMNAAATARADGHTVGVITFQLSTYDLMGVADLDYANFEPIQLMNQSPSAITVRADSPFETLEDLVAYAEVDPGVVTVGHAGTGGAWHLGVAAVAEEIGVEFNYVPFDGGAPTRSALLGGHIAVAASGIDEMLQLYQDGQVRILAVNAEARHPLFPDVPTTAEAGYAIEGLVYDWRGLGTPLGVPEENLAVLREGFAQCFEIAAFRQAAEELGFLLTYRDHEGFSTFMQDMEATLEPVLATQGLLGEQR